VGVEQIALTGSEKDRLHIVVNVASDFPLLRRHALESLNHPKFHNLRNGSHDVSGPSPKVRPLRLHRPVQQCLPQPALRMAVADRRIRQLLYGRRSAHERQTKQGRCFHHWIMPALCPESGFAFSTGVRPVRRVGHLALQLLRPPI
jgi:hypothetical protein